MAETVKIGILGCAKVAEKYAIRAFQAIPNAEVVSVASRDSAKAEEWAGRFGIKEYSDYDGLIANPAIDALYVPLPIGLHKEWAIKAASNRKHIICEKSLAENLAAVKEIVDACRSNGVTLYENFMCDFHPQHQKVLSLIGEGRIGKPFLFSGNFGFPLSDKKNFRFNKLLGGGALNDAGAYTVFMARKILSKEPIAITGKLFYDKETGVDVKGLALAEFQDEMTAQLSFSFDAVYQNNYSVWGTKGLIKIDRAYSIPSDMKPVIKLVTNEGLAETVTAIDAPSANHFELIFRDFCDTIINRKTETAKIEKKYAEIVYQAKTLEALRISAEENRKVKITEIS